MLFHHFYNYVSDPFVKGLHDTMLHVWAQTAIDVGYAAACIHQAAEAKHLSTRDLAWGVYQAGGRER
jgi:hypothetical protein